MSLLKKAIVLSTSLVALYVAIVIGLCFETPQTLMIYLHWLQAPLYAKFDTPEYYGFAHNAIRNIQIKTEDNITLGAWHILPSEYHIEQKLNIMDQVTNDIFDQALMDVKYDTVIYFHGNAMNRVAPWRIDLYKNLRMKFPKLNILALDYRGFGDSEGSPSEYGLQLDAQATYNWLLSKKVSHDRISLIGHSLGTGVATTLAHDLSRKGTPPKTLILQAPYTSLSHLVFEYRLLEYIPILGPLKWSSFAKELMLSRLNHRFDSLSRISKVSCPILIVVGQHDIEIPVDHSTQLFYEALIGKDDDWLTKKKNEIQVYEIKNEAKVYIKKSSDKSSSLVELVYLEHANHNNLGYFDYLYTAIGDVTHWTSNM
ncbi:Alpha/Beta hydrolase protein [Halteromyces radiatus]|uniref:Alpha/Beta hydrolase protein n=1 Tax=Halteromyces radiatus TaxID=101107 RepID=UPI00222089FF|nr:Alpha/Beta hydrolase protein [Halteromyces radiatus]KAI8086085.1 Alpha/Beta hydrolase protein [Halteromyces radiatus]